MGTLGRLLLDAIGVWFLCGIVGVLLIWIFGKLIALLNPEERITIPPEMVETLIVCGPVTFMIGIAFFSLLCYMLVKEKLVTPIVNFCSRRNH